MLYNRKDFYEERGKSLMKKLYGTIMINKQILDKQKMVQENISYYKLKDKKYGIEIVKENVERENLEIANLINITDSEEAVNHILSMLVKKEIMPRDADVIDDIVKQYA